MKKVKKWFLNGPNRLKKVKKGVRKVQKYHEKVKKVQKSTNEIPQKCLENEPFYCKMNHCEMQQKQKGQ